MNLGRSQEKWRAIMARWTPGGGDAVGPALIPWSMFGSTESWPKKKNRVWSWPRLGIILDSIEAPNLQKMKGIYGMFGLPDKEMPWDLLRSRPACLETQNLDDPVNKTTNNKKKREFGRGRDLHYLLIEMKKG